MERILGQDKMHEDLKELRGKRGGSDSGTCAAISLLPTAVTAAIYKADCKAAGPVGATSLPAPGRYPILTKIRPGPAPGPQPAPDWLSSRVPPPQVFSRPTPYACHRLLPCPLSHPFLPQLHSHPLGLAPVTLPVPGQANLIPTLPTIAFASVRFNLTCLAVRRQ